jgi:hypothetical protein
MNDAVLHLCEVALAEEGRRISHMAPNPVIDEIMNLCKQFALGILPYSAVYERRQYLHRAIEQSLPEISSISSPDGGRDITETARNLLWWATSEYPGVGAYLAMRAFEDRPDVWPDPIDVLRALVLDGQG